jgi:hypothetical protein
VARKKRPGANPSDETESSSAEGSPTPAGDAATETPAKIAENESAIGDLQSQSATAEARMKALEAAAEVASIASEAKAAAMAAALAANVAPEPVKAAEVAEVAEVAEEAEEAEVAEEEASKPSLSQAASGDLKTIEVAYALWALSFCGLSGLHRFYLGRTGTGLAFLFTWGLCGWGSIYDAVTMKRLVAEANSKPK